MRISGPGLRRQGRRRVLNGRQVPSLRSLFNLPNLKAACPYVQVIVNLREFRLGSFKELRALHRRSSSVRSCTMRMIGDA
jgi:hypothetical protein